MKKFIAIACCVSMCAAMSVTAFGEELAGSNSMSIYATESETATVLAEMEQTNAAVSLQEFGVAVDADTTMPVYHASLLDFAESGEFEYEPFMLEGEQLYISNAVDATGDFAGVIGFNADDVHIYMPTTDINKSVDFNSNLNRVNSLTERSAVPVATDAKFMFVDGLGYVYYMENGTDAVLVSAGLKGANGDIFTAENGGIVAIDDDLMKYAEHLVEVKEENELYLSTLAPGENPMTGSATPAFIVDNAQYNTNTYLTIAAALGALGVFSAVGYVVVSKKTN